jgi:hypothetical protein
MVAMPAITALGNSVSSPAEADLNEREACFELARGFSEYALVHAGPVAAGHELIGCRHTNNPARYAADGTLYHPATDFFTFAYGHCEIPAGSSACPIPVTIQIFPECSRRVTDVAAALAGGADTIRSVPVYSPRGGGRAIILTPAGYNIKIYAPGPTGDEQVAAARSIAETLQGANALAAGLDAGDPMTAQALSLPAACR